MQMPLFHFPPPALAPINPLFPSPQMAVHLPMQKPLYEIKKVWIGKIPESVSNTFMLKLLETCGQVCSWKRMTDAKGKLNSFGICEYTMVESMLKCLRLLNNLPIDDSELQVKVGSEAEEFLKQWRERKKLEWICTLRMKGMNVDINEIQKKEENGEPLEWELQLVNKDHETLKLINEVLNQRKEIEVYARQTQKPELFLKDLRELASGTLSTHFESERERERQKKKAERLKKMEKAFREEERKWLKHEEDKEKELSYLKHEKEYLALKKQKLMEKDLNYNSDIEKKKMLSNPKKYEEHEKERIKEKEYDNAMRKKENNLLFKDKTLIHNSTLNDFSNALVQLPKEPEAKTKLTVVHEYKSEDIQPTISEQHDDNNNNNKTQIQLVKLVDFPNNKHITTHINKIEEDDIDDLYSRTKNVSTAIEINPETEKELLNMAKDVSNSNNNNNINKDEYYSIDNIIKTITPDKYRSIQKNIVTLIPKDKDSILKYPINWNIVVNYKIKQHKLKMWLEKKLVEYFDEVDSFTQLLLEKIGRNNPYEILDTIKQVLDDEAEVRYYIYMFIYVYRGLC